MSLQNIIEVEVFYFWGIDFVGIFWYKMNSIIAVLYFNGRVYEENDGIIFEGSKKEIQINHGMSYNALKKKIGEKVLKKGFCL